MGQGCPRMPVACGADVKDARRLRPVALRLSADSVDSFDYSALWPISEDSRVK